MLHVSQVTENWMHKNKQLQQRLRQEPEQVIEERTRTCRHCGQPIIPRIWKHDRPGRLEKVETRTLIIPDKHGCPEERIYLANLETETRERAIKDEWQLAMKRAGLTGWLSQATFGNFNTEGWDGLPHIFGRVKSYAYAVSRNALNGSPWLIMYGGFGTGKTHLSAAIIHHLMGEGWRGCYFRVWPEYLNRIKASWNHRDDPQWETDDQIAAELQKGKLVVIDDLDKQQPTEWVKGILYAALNYRYNEQLPTVLTFNYGPEDKDTKANRLALVEYLGGAVLDRLMHVAFDTIHFDGPSHRSGVAWKQPLDAA